MTHPQRLIKTYNSVEEKHTVEQSTHPYHQQFTLREWRDKLSLSVDQLAKAAQVNTRIVQSASFTGQHSVREDDMVKILVVINRLARENELLKADDPDLTPEDIKGFTPYEPDKPWTQHRR